MMAASIVIRWNWEMIPLLINNICFFLVDIIYKNKEQIERINKKNPLVVKSKGASGRGYAYDVF